MRVGDNVEVVLLHISGNTAKIGIEAPKETLILRTELAGKEQAPEK